jgi:Icc-related predicted phosphoesterase
MTKPLVFAVVGDSHYVRPDSHQTAFAQLARVAGGRNHDLYRYIHFHERIIPQIIEEISRFKPDFVVNTGDIIQGNCDDTATALLEMEEALQRFERSGAPVFYAVGNHDGHPHKEPVKQLVYAANSRSLGSPVEQGYYRFVKDRSLFIVLDFTEFESGDAQEAFLHESLQAGAEYEHVFVFAHPPLIPVIRPFFSKYDFAHTVLCSLEEHRVDAYFCGHTHNQIASLHRVGDYWLPQLKSSMIGEPEDAPVRIQDVRRLLPREDNCELLWGYMEDTAPGWWIVTVDGGKVTADWYTLSHSLSHKRAVAGQLTWEDGVKANATIVPEFAAPISHARPNAAEIVSVRLRAAGSSCNAEGAYKVSLNGQAIGSLPRLGAFAIRSFLPVPPELWPGLADVNRLTVTTADEEMCIGGFVLEIETAAGWVYSEPTEFYTNSHRWDEWGAQGIRHIDRSGEVHTELVFKQEGTK